MEAARPGFKRVVRVDQDLLLDEIENELGLDHKLPGCACRVEPGQIIGFVFIPEKGQPQARTRRIGNGARRFKTQHTVGREPEMAARDAVYIVHSTQSKRAVDAGLVVSGISGGFVPLVLRTALVSRHRPDIAPGIRSALVRCRVLFLRRSDARSDSQGQQDPEERMEQKTGSARGGAAEGFGSGVAWEFVSLNSR